MKQAVFVGGFGNGHATVDTVGHELEPYFSDVVTFTLSEFINGQDKVEKAVKGSALITHSAGALSLKRLVTRPTEAYLLNPPLPLPVYELGIRALAKNARLYIPGKGLHSWSEMPTISAFGRANLKEIANHPVANYGQVSEISKFSAVLTAVEAIKEGTPTEIVWTSEDAYFKPQSTDIAMAAANGVRARIIPGEHDEVLIRPTEFLRAVFEPEA